MRSSLFIAGFLIFAFGMILLLPSIVLSAASSNIQTKGQAVSLIVGNIVKDLSGTNPNDLTKANLLSKLPALLVAIGLMLMLISFILKI